MSIKQLLLAEKNRVLSLLQQKSFVAASPLISVQSVDLIGLLLVNRLNVIGFMHFLWNVKLITCKKCASRMQTLRFC